MTATLERLPVIGGSRDSNTLFPINRERGPLTIISNGSGQDSSALIVRIGLDRDVRKDLAPRDLIIVGSDPGNEAPETYAQVEWLRKFCRKHGIEFHFLTPDMGYHNPSWLTLETQWARNDSVGSQKGFKRSCTDNLKIIPLYNFCEDVVPARYGIPIKGQKRGLKAFGARFGPMDMILGYTKGEESRCATEEDVANDDEFMRAAVRRRYPLIEWGWTRLDCQAYLRSVGAPVPVPSQCLGCHFKSKLDVWWTYRFYPEWIAKWIEYEARKIAKFANRPGPNHGVFGKALLPEVLAEAEALYGHMTDEELQAKRMTHGHCISLRH
jgi:3'-phosphoadenosine 5'-phosphosulfate sulfotransferase (PAPS reductase)/FAD synthetase